MTKRQSRPNTEADNVVQEILCKKEKRCFVMIAGAGSGKTTSLIKALNFACERFGTELAQKDQQIACITYTEVAVEEIRRDTGSSQLIHVSTIHSFLWSIIKPFQKDISNWVTTKLKSDIAELKQKMGSYGPRVHASTKTKDAQKLARLEKQLPQISSVPKFFYESGRNYTEGILGHDDIIKMVPQLIIEKKLLRKIVAQKYPFFFIDESQDTFRNFVDALFDIAKDNQKTFCLGFFGDPMQKIYTTGIGDIVAPDHWQKITKPENFRSPSAILSIVNNIRRDGDKLVQKSGRQPVAEEDTKLTNKGFLFVLPADDQRSENLLRVRNWLAINTGDKEWVDATDSNNFRILVLVHGIAALRLGFADLHAAFYENGSDSLKSRYIEGKSWQLKPLVEVLLPLSNYYLNNKRFDLISKLRKCSPVFAEINESTDLPKLLAGLRKGVEEMANLIEEKETIISDVLLLAKSHKLLKLDDRFDEYLKPPNEAASSNPNTGIDQEVAKETNEDDRTKDENATRAFLKCKIGEVSNYKFYLEELSPYSTQQGVKGAEFDRVLVILDEEDGQHIHFSYEKLLGIKALSDADKKNIAEGKESVVDRTRRLFYVCCSRATRTLAVVLYTRNPKESAEIVRTKKMFDDSMIILLDQLEGHN